MKMEFTISYDVQLLNMVKQIHTPKIRPQMLLITILWATNPKRAGLFCLSQVRGGGGFRPPLGSRPRSNEQF